MKGRPDDHLISLLLEGVMAVLVVLLSIALLMHWKKNADTKAVLPVYALCFLNVVGIGYYGGEIVFGGAGRQQTPAEEKKAEDRQPKERVTFADVSPIFEQHCNTCHKGSSAPPKAAGKIIFISSVHDVIPWAGHANYAASKGGVNMLMKSQFTGDEASVR
jgi:NAD(P)-dependent dehydrogenase (short-subunit alcohol dehydrogenase family)